MPINRCMATCPSRRGMISLIVVLAFGLAPVRGDAQSWLCRYLIRDARHSLDSLDGLWSRDFFTDPLKHQPLSYAYFVHAIFPNLPYGTRSWLPEAAEWEAKNLRERFADYLEKTILSASVITAEQSKTYGSYGFLLAPPRKSQVLVTSSQDAMTPNSRNASLYADPEVLKREILKEFENTEILEAPMLIQGMRKPEDLKYNEVLVKGLLFEEKVPPIIGLFYTTSRNQMKTPLKVYEELKKLSLETGLPLIPIDQVY